MRNLVSIQIIKNLESIENSDFLEKATILGWSAVVKKDQFKIGDPCVFFEIDSLLPDEPRYEFLKKNSWNTQRQKIRIKTAKLRGCLSQGLVMPLSDFPELTCILPATDVTDELNVEKYEPILSPQLAGNVNSFNWPITKTDEARVQSNPKAFLNSIHGKPYYISVKIDGTSSSFILNTDGVYHVCSHNYSIKENPDNTYWKISNFYDIEKVLRRHQENTGEYLAIQGEIAGPGIQSNKLGLAVNELYIFNIVNVKNNERFSLDDCRKFCFDNDLEFVIVIEEGSSFPYETQEEMLNLAKGKYLDFFMRADKNQDREGIVVRTKDQEITFKVINNDFLLKGGDE